MLPLAPGDRRCFAAKPEFALGSLAGTCGFSGGGFSDGTCYCYGIFSCGYSDGGFSDGTYGYANNAPDDGFSDGGFRDGTYGDANNAPDDDGFSDGAYGCDAASNNAPDGGFSDGTFDDG